jgi:pimeloyl-ACP methyl ester carboxylesterase
MAGFVGADIEQLSVLASLFERKAQALRHMAGVSTASLMVAVWVGADIDVIRSEWNRDAKSAMLKAASQLLGLAFDLRTQAEEQRRASAAPLPASHQSARKISTSRIIDTLKELPSDDLMRIEKVVGSDGVVRYVVYINGTIGNITKITVENYYRVHGWGWNVEASFNAKTPAETLIAETLRRRLADDGQSGAEVMLVGYSQGGMVAQTLADREEFNVKEVLTIGSPQVAPMNGYHGAHVTRLFHNGDQAENSTEIARALVLGLPLDILVHASAGGDPRIGQAHEFRAGTPGFFAHDLHKGDYNWLADQYDKSTNPVDIASRERQSVFLSGEVTAKADLTEATK